jgi:hypothetical protein
MHADSAGPSGSDCILTIARKTGDPASSAASVLGDSASDALRGELERLRTDHARAVEEATDLKVTCLCDAILCWKISKSKYSGVEACMLGPLLHSDDFAKYHTRTLTLRRCRF